MLTREPCDLCSEPVCQECGVCLMCAGDGHDEGCTVGMPPPCQPIGCDNGYHLAGCPYAEVDA